MKVEQQRLQCRPRSLRNAFTLIELLVVVAIIALLISILTPSLSDAREQAKRTKCGVNLRSISQALAACAGENNGYGPSWDDGEITQPRPWRLYTWAEVLFDTGYLGDIDAALCPTDRRPDIPLELRASEPGWNYRWTNQPGIGETQKKGYRGSYGINAIMHANFREDQYQDAARQAHIADSWWAWFSSVHAGSVMYTRATGQRPPSAFWPNEGASIGWRHGKQYRANMLYVDGHVETLVPQVPRSQQDLQFGTVDTARTFTWLPGEWSGRNRYDRYQQGNYPGRITAFDGRRPRWVEVRETGRGGRSLGMSDAPNSGDNWHPYNYPEELSAMWRSRNNAWRNIPSAPAQRF